MTNSEVLLKAKVDDAVRLSGKTAKFVGFLDPAECVFAKNYVKYNGDALFAFEGGFPEAERQILAVFQKYNRPEGFPLVPITLSFRQQDLLSHRDFLGSFMAEGIKRSAVGDILVEPGRAVVFVKTELADYFLRNISKVGRVGVQTSLGTTDSLPNAHVFEDLSGVVASPRLDCLVAFFAKTSREKAAAMITAGLVVVNHRESKSVSQQLQESDKIALRGMGKFTIDQLGPVTKKGRLALRCRKYK